MHDDCWAFMVYEKSETFMLKKIVSFQRMLFINTPKINNTYELVMIFLALALTSVHTGLSMLVFMGGFIYIIYQRMYQKKTEALLLPVSKKFYINSLYVYGFMSIIEMLSIFIVILLVFILCVCILTIFLNSWVMLLNLWYELPNISLEDISVFLLLLDLYLSSLTIMIVMKKGKNVVALLVLLFGLSILLYLLMKGNLIMQYVILITSIALIGICPRLAYHFAKLY